jgi:uncharacterized protein
MIPAQFHVDIISELERILPSYKLLVPIFVVEELKNLKKSRGFNKIAASIALKIVFSSDISISPAKLRKNERVDEALLRISKILCTNDRELKKKAKNKGIDIVYLRQKKYLVIERN